MDRVLSVAGGSVAVLAAMLVGTGTAGATTPSPMPYSVSVAMTGQSGGGGNGTDCVSTDMTGSSDSSECPGQDYFNMKFGTGNGSAGASTAVTPETGSGSASPGGGSPAAVSSDSSTATAVMAAIQDFIRALFAALGLTAPSGTGSQAT